MKHYGWVQNTQVGPQAPDLGGPPLRAPPYSQHSCRAQAGPRGRTDKRAARPPHSQALERRMSRWVPPLVTRYRPRKTGLLAQPHHSDGLTGHGSAKVRRQEDKRSRGWLSDPAGQSLAFTQGLQNSWAPGAGGPGHTCAGWPLPLPQTAGAGAWRGHYAQGGRTGRGRSPHTLPFLPVFSTKDLLPFEWG